MKGRLDVLDILALSPMQEGILYHSNRDGDGREYFEQLSLRMGGVLDRAAFLQSWEWVQQTNAALRTVFRWRKLEHPVQMILRKAELPLREYDFSMVLDATQRQQMVEEVKLQDLSTVFDLENGPLFRLTLCKLGAEEYELIISNHHIIMDGWSTGIILKEFYQAYRQLVAGQEIEVPTKTPFKEYIKWLQAKDHAKGKAFWREKLAYYTAKRILFPDFPEAREERDTATYTYQFPDELQQALLALARVKNVTPGTLFYTLWVLLLQRYTGSTDVLFGTPVASRPAGIVGVEEMVGLFINTLPLRVHIADAIHLSDLVDRVAEELEEIQQYAYTPLAEIHSLWRGETQGTGAIFDTIVVIENYPLPEWAKTPEEGLYLRSYEMREMNSYDLAVEISAFGSFALHLHFNPAKYAADTILRLQEHYFQLAHELIKDGDVRTDTVQMLTTAEESLLLNHFNQTAAEYPRDRTVQALFRKTVEAWPDGVAVVCQNRQLTYAALDRQSDSVAVVLRERGVGPEEVVGIMVEPSLEMIAGLLGILKAGGAFLPIDPLYPAQRIQYVLSDSGARILLTQQGLAAQLEPVTQEVMYLDAEEWPSDTDTVVDLAKPADLAYVIYTSGSTGQPKGVMVEHRSLVNLCVWHNREFALTPADRCTKYAGFGFDASVWEIFPPLLAGATLHMLEPEVKLDCERLNTFYEEAQITVSFLPTQMAEQFMGVENRSLRILFTAGDKLSQFIPRNYRLYNLYGPTEATVCTTYYPVYENLANIPVGRPLANAQVLVLDQYGRLQPVGVPGELCIAGDLLARGYLHRPELTRQKFVSHPYRSGHRMYRSGDLARWLPDGNLEFLGRIDEQVKIRGFRIELGEIEHVLKQHPAIEAAAVVATDKGVEKYLVGYYVVHAPVEQSELVEYLQQSLPYYMIPAYFHQLEALPLTTHGKIDRQALPAPERAMGGTEYQAPRDWLEEELAQIWAHVLNLERAGVTDDFFRLGGHSLNVMSVLGRIARRLGREVPVGVFFAHPTVAELAQYLRENGVEESLVRGDHPKGGDHNVSDATPRVPELLAVEHLESYPLSSAQKRLFILHQLTGGDLSYNISAVLEVHGEIDVSRLELTFQQVIRRQEAFRTIFVNVEGEPRQKILREVDFRLDCREVQEVDLVRAVEQFIQPFDLSIAPLLRVGVFRSEQKSYLIFDTHHIVADGFSMSILLDELRTFYGGNDLPELRVQYKDFAAWQNELHTLAGLKVQEEYWVQRFAELPPPLELPARLWQMGQRPRVRSFEGDHVVFAIECGLTEQLKQLALERGVTLYMLLLAAYCVLLARYSGQEDLVVGSPVAGRRLEEWEQIIGMFVNTLPLRNLPAGEKRFTQFLQEVKQNTLEAFAHQDYQFEQLVERLHLERDLSRNPLFDVMFVLQNASPQELSIGSLQLKALDFQNKVARFDLTLEITESDGRLECSLGYWTKLFAAETVEQMARHFTSIVEAICADLEVRIGAIEMLTPGERQILLYGFNPAPTWYPQEKTVQHLFAEQVARTGDAIALVYREQQMTYAELNQKTNLLARLLRQKGVGANQFVGVLVNESLEMVVGILAVLKAGGAFLPIDPKYPVERIRYMLVDSSTRVVLTQRELAGLLADASVQSEASTDGREMCAGVQSEASTDGREMCAGVQSEASADGREMCAGVQSEASADGREMCAGKQSETSVAKHDMCMGTQSEVSVDGQRKMGADESRVMTVGREVIFLDDVRSYTGRSGEESLGLQSLDDNAGLKAVNQPADLAYLIYTSGSTGRPKGVMVEHRSLVNLVVWHNTAYGVTAEDRCTKYAGFGFDASVWEIFPCILAGGSLYIIPEELKLDLRGLNNYFEKNGITLSFLPTQVCEQFMVLANSSLRLLHTAGDRLKSFISQNYQLVNNYGPTETTVCTTSFVVQCEEVSIPIGKPIANTKVYVVNPQGSLQPIGVPGELWVGGESLARGYLNRRELTAERFLPDPFSAGGRVYRTGDLVCWLPDGNLEFMGRIDEQVKIRGFRIEPGEIEHALLTNPTIRNVVVVAEDGEDGDKYLIAYYVRQAPVTGNELRDYLVQRLPAYMIPAYFVEMEVLPLTPNGKVDRRALPAVQKQEHQSEYVLPRNPLEAKLALIWSELLSVERIGITDHFFALGGHSLLASRLTARIFKEFSVEVPLQEIFQRPTIAELAEWIQSGEEKVFTQIEPALARKFYPLSSAQARLYVLNELEGNLTTYNMPGVLAVEGELALVRLEQAFLELIARHDVFRTSFQLVDGEPVQFVQQEVRFQLEQIMVEEEGTETDANRLVVAEGGEVDAASEPFIKNGEEVNVESEARAAEDGRIATAGALATAITAFVRPFDLTAPPLLRAGVFRANGQTYLLYDLHHIIADGFSMRVLVEEILQFYAGVELPALRIQYTDFAIWQNDLLCSPLMHQEEMYWRQQFAGEIPVLTLPTDYPRPAVRDHRGQTVAFVIEQEMVQRMQALLLERGATLYMFLLAAYTVFLGKYAGQDEIIVGSPVAGRSHHDLEGLIGMFANTLALRNRLRPEETFAGLLAEVKETALAAFSHQHYPFERLVEELELERDLSRNPLFDAMLVLQNLGLPTRIETAGVRFKSVSLENTTAKFDLLWNALETEKGLECTLEYATALFAQGTAERMVRHLSRIIELAVADPEIVLADLEMILPEEKSQILDVFNATEEEYRRDLTIDRWFSMQAAKFADRVALRQDGARMTYQELEFYSGEVALYLRAKGVQSGSIVGLMLYPSFALITGMLGILKAGGAYLPLDPGYPTERIQTMLTDSGLRVLLTSEELRGTVSLLDVAQLEVVTMEKLLGHEPGAGVGLDGTGITEGAFPERSVGQSGEVSRQGTSEQKKEVVEHGRDSAEALHTATPEDAVYIIYTSGSTGKPKGVILEHRNLVNLIAFEYARTNVDFSRRVLQFASVSFDVSFQEIFSTLLAGGELHLLDREVRTDPPALCKYLATNQIEVVFLPTAFAKFLFSNPEWQSQFPACVRHLIVAGEQLVIGHGLRQHLEEHGVFLHNHYGPSETHVVTTLTLDPGEPVPQVPAIGRPLANNRIYIFDGNGHLQPPGVVGELYIAGANVGRGYLHRPDLTQERFLSDPFVQGARMYRTGDLARWLPDGNIEYLGRADHQVKIRGFRVELGEIEQQVLQHEQVKEAVTLAKPGTDGNNYLVLYYVAAGELTSGQLRDYLVSKLPVYMIPGYLVRLEAMPVNRNGKIHRQALPAVDPSQYASPAQTLPSGVLESEMAGIWAELLGVPAPGANDNFFALGGHSLKGVQAVALMQKPWNVELTLRDLFQNPTIRELAGVVKERLAHQQGSYCPIPRLPEAEYYPVSHTQRRLYILHQRYPERPAYNMAARTTLQGELDAALVGQILTQLVQRHESLRTTFTIEEGQVVQKISATVQANLQYIDLTARDAADRHQEREVIYAREAVQPFDLARGPLLRVTLVRLEESRYDLIFVLHHIISDGWSMEVLRREFGQLYEAALAGQPITTGRWVPLEVQYRDFAAWQNQLLADTAKMEQAKAFWQHQLSGNLVSLRLPTDYPVRPMLERASAAYRTVISRELKDGLLTLAREHNASLFMVLLAGFNVLLYRLTGQTKLLLGIPAAGRVHENLHNVVGFFVNTLLLHHEINPEETFLLLLQQSQENSLQVLEYQTYPLEEIIAELGIEYPEIPVFFNMLNLGETAHDELTDLTAAHRDELMEVKFDMAWYLREYANGLEIDCNYLKALFKPETIAYFVNEYIRILEAILANPTLTVKEYRHSGSEGKVETRKGVKKIW